MGEEGPFRMPRSAGGGTNRPEQDEPQVHEEPVKPVRHHAVSHHHVSEVAQPSPQRFVLPAVAAAVVVVVLLIIAWFAWWSPRDNTAAAINTKEYQALFLTNGQVYFGKLQAFNGGYFKLTDVFYLQSNTTDTSTDSKNPQQTNGSNTSNSVTITHLGSDQIHDPEDEMVVNKDEVLFFENIKSNGKVAQAIQSYKTSHK